MAKRAEASAVRKANRDFLSALFLAIQAGAFIAFGAAFFTHVIHDSTLGIGLTKLLGGLAFSLGLILVIIAGADLFTGDTLMVMACYSRSIKINQMLRSWLIVLIGNLIGALAIVFLVYLSGHWLENNGAIGTVALEIAHAKTNLTYTQAFASGMLCNVLVCLAIWLCYSARSVTDKILSIIFPITAFVAMGFEHSIANMYFLPAGWLLSHQPEFASLYPHPITRPLILQNLIPVTVGNMVGGAIFVGTVYWILYLRRGAPAPKSGDQT
jgi:formate/nitrite transporter